MIERLKAAIDSENEQALKELLDFKKQHQMDANHYNLIEQALKGTWHSQHEELVNMIYLQSLNDDRFVEPILSIALDRKRFRWYDDELEATLRKCVHALKMIGSDRSNRALQALEGLNNDNVMVVLEMYS